MVKEKLSLGFWVTKIDIEVACICFCGPPSLNKHKTVLSLYRVNFKNNNAYQVNGLFCLQIYLISTTALSDTVRRLYFATAVFALFLCEILIKYYTQWQF